MGLMLKEKICLTTPFGESEIQLLFGDITKLPMEESVDTLFVSAFPGDYQPIPGTLIGALKKNLGLVVGRLAQNKDVDLRLNFNCWVSKPLPDHLPFKRLVCFERINRFETLPDQISGIFRAMMAVFNNQESSVITPLLASGDQGHSETVVLKAIVRGACHWIKAGLPLKCLKIVVFTRDLDHVSSFYQELMECFSRLKSEWEDKQMQQFLTVVKKFDVCLSYSEGDEQLVKEICSDLEKLDTGIVIHKNLFVYNHTTVWQEQIFSVMVDSRKIVAVLTPNYVGKSECLEQFNLALCCNRLTGAEVLFPFYAQTVDIFPSYMTLIQYVECRVRKDGEKAEEKIFKACCTLVKEIDKDKAVGSSDTSSIKSSEISVNSSEPKTSLKPTSEPPSVYDIFISYSHKTPKEATKMYENLLEIDPDAKVFLDRSELRTGNSWQETLYEAVDKAKVVVVFLSKSYMQSSVCQEEYNIALARYISMDGIYFLPLLVDAEVDELPPMFSAAPLVDITDLLYEEDRYIIAEAPIKWVEAQKKGQPIINQFCQVEPRKTRISYITVNWRERNFHTRFNCEKDKGIWLKETSPPVKTAESSPKTVAFSVAKDRFRQAAILSHLLRKEGGSSVTCEFLTLPQDSNTVVQAPKLPLLDSADMIVVIVSDDYMDSTQHCQELHTALCRQRMSKDKRILYLIESGHSNLSPIYANLLHYSINVDDEMWMCLARRLKRDITSMTVKVPDMAAFSVTCSAGEYEALHAAALDILDKLMAEDTNGDSGMPTNIVNLINLKDIELNSVPVDERLVPFSILRNERLVSGANPSEAAPPPNQGLVKRVTEMTLHKPNEKKKSQISRKIQSSRSCQIL